MEIASTFSVGSAMPAGVIFAGNWKVKYHEYLGEYFKRTTDPNKDHNKHNTVFGTGYQKSSSAVK